MSWSALASLLLVGVIACGSADGPEPSTPPPSPSSPSPTATPIPEPTFSRAGCPVTDDAFCDTATRIGRALIERDAAALLRLSRSGTIECAEVAREDFPGCADADALTGYGLSGAEFLVDVVPRSARRFYNGGTASWEFLPTLMRLGGAYDPHTSFRALLRQMMAERHMKPRAEAHHFAVTQLTKGWSVMDRLEEIEAPTLVIAGREDFLFPPEHQEQLAAGIPNARLRIFDRAGHNPHDERTDEVMTVVAEFLIG